MVHQQKKQNNKTINNNNNNSSNWIFATLLCVRLISGAQIGRASYTVGSQSQQCNCRADEWVKLLLLLLLLPALELAIWSPDARMLLAH